MKIYYVTGEKSGDLLALWHVKKHWPDAQIRGVGGDHLALAGELDLHYTEFSVLGALSIIWSLPKIYFLLKKIVDRIFDFSPDYVVLVNFSQANLFLAQLLKKRDAKIKIIFFSPPQLWIWGSWRIQKIKKYIDQVEVIFPFEVAWYKTHGVQAFYHGSPIFDRLVPHLNQRSPVPSVLCFPGSRKQELERMVPIFFKTMQLFQQKEPGVTIVIAATDQKYVLLLQEKSIEFRLKNCIVLTSEDEIVEAMKSATLALAKPGTNTLELALMGVPTLVAFSAPWLTYQIARQIIRPAWLSLPNLLLHKELFQEFLQEQTKPELLSHSLHQLYKKVQITKELTVFTQASFDLKKILNSKP